MSTNALATSNKQNDMLEQVLVNGDLSRLSPEQRLTYYRATCESLGLNPLTKPFDYLKLSGRLVLYARKDAADQLRRIHGVSIEIASRERIDDVYVVTALARLTDGRTDSEIGAVPVAGLKGESLANALMKATTKAKRRVTLSICGLGMLDETETETIPAQQRQFVEVDHDTGEILDAPQAQPAAPSPANEVSAAQAGYIESLAHDIGFDSAALEELLADRYGHTLHGLSKSEASAFIEHLQAIKGTSGAAGKPQYDERPGGITEAQNKAVHAIGAKMEMSHAEINEYSAGRFSKAVKELSKEDASVLIADLQELSKQG